MDIIYCSKTLEINNSTIDATNSTANVICLFKEGNVILNNVDIKGNTTTDKYMFYFKGAYTLCINGGKFTNCSYGVESSTSTITIKGNISDKDPSGHIDEMNKGY